MGAKNNIELIISRFGKDEIYTILIGSGLGMVYLCVFSFYEFLNNKLFILSSHSLGFISICFVFSFLGIVVNYAFSVLHYFIFYCVFKKRCKKEEEEKEKMVIHVKTWKNYLTVYIHLPSLLAFAALFSIPAVWIALANVFDGYSCMLLYQILITALFGFSFLVLIVFSTKNIENQVRTDLCKNKYYTLDDNEYLKKINQ